MSMKKICLDGLSFEEQLRLVKRYLKMRNLNYANDYSHRSFEEQMMRKFKVNLSHDEKKELLNRLYESA